MSTQGDQNPEPSGTDVKTLSDKLCIAATETKSLFSSNCIHRVPKDLRKLKTSAYIPRLICIGPYHQKPRFMNAPMQHVKMSYAHSLISRVAKSEKQEFEAVLRDCEARIKALMKDANNWYAKEGDNHSHQNNDPELMLVDGCFIIEHLYKSKNFATLSEEEKRANPNLSNFWNETFIQHDLMLLENQIPFSVLQDLFDLTVGRMTCGHKYFSLTEYVSHYFAGLMSPDPGSSNHHATCCSPRDCILWVLDLNLNDTKEVLSVNGDHYYHILHKVHDDYRPCDIPKRKDFTSLMPCASELIHAGIKFVPGKGNDLFNVRFTEPKGPFWWCCRARFEIPTLGIYDLTESFLRNFIAFEQCYHDVSQHFTSYAFLMDMLVNSDKDVQELVEAGVMHNYLGSSEDATTLFNNLCKEVFLGEFFFADACIRATEYSKRCWPKNLAHIRRQYFASPWKFIGFCLAVVAFAITVFQFVRSIL